MIISVSWRRLELQCRLDECCGRRRRDRDAPPGVGKTLYLTPYARFWRRNYRRRHGRRRYRRLCLDNARATRLV